MRLLAMLAVFLTHCSATPPPEAPAAPAAKPIMESSASSTITIEATVTAEGVECPAVRTADGKLYTIAAPPAEKAKLKPGARVRITGSIAEMSTCMQGTTISAETIEVLK